jgi:hypothetical protein
MKRTLLLSVLSAAGLALVASPSQAATEPPCSPSAAVEVPCVTTPPCAPAEAPCLS